LNRGPGQHHEQSAHAVHRRQRVLGLFKGNISLNAPADSQVNGKSTSMGVGTHNVAHYGAAINPGGYSGDFLFNQTSQEERPNVSTGNLPQVR